ncbi:MAG: hypothetical protein N3A54_07280 [Patescibacteria group bacterium]|nr:hypothetical protein [Patescibacteria group bacterium]
MFTHYGVESEIDKILERKVFFFLLIWFLSSPLPAAMTTQAPHAMRSYTFLPLWQIFGSFGIVYAARSLRHQTRIIVGVIFFLLIIAHGRDFFMNYFYVFPRTQSDSFSYAVADAMRYVELKKDLYEKIVISNILGDRYQYPSYMFFLFYTRFDPYTYFLYGGTKSGNFQAKHMFGKYEFRPIHSDERRKNALYVDNYFEVADGKTIQYIARYLDGRPGVMIYTYE